MSLNNNLHNKIVFVGNKSDEKYLTEFVKTIK